MQPFKVRTELKALILAKINSLSNAAHFIMVLNLKVINIWRKHFRKILRRNISLVLNRSRYFLEQSCSLRYHCILSAFYDYFAGHTMSVMQLQLTRALFPSHSLRWPSTPTPPALPSHYPPPPSLEEGPQGASRSCQNNPNRRCEPYSKWGNR